MNKTLLILIAIFTMKSIQAQINPPLGITTTVTPASNCTTPCNGTATVTNVSGGTPPYTYLWNIPGNPQQTQTATGLCPGQWQVGVWDASTPIPNQGTTLVTITCVTANGIADVSSKNDLIIFPNPAHDELFLQTDLSMNETKEISIVNMLGTIVYSGTMNGNKNINISLLPSGVYSVELTGGSAVIRKRFIKN